MNKIIGAGLILSYFSFLMFEDWEYVRILRLLTSTFVGASFGRLLSQEWQIREYNSFIKSYIDHDLDKDK